jgi:hypothetical protein
MNKPITCPRCGMTSSNPNDVANGYCGNCRDFTSAPEVVSGGSYARVEGGPTEWATVFYPIPDRQKEGGEGECPAP